jgi:hypothetical protein
MKSSRENSLSLYFKRSRNTKMGGCEQRNYIMSDAQIVYIGADEGGKYLWGDISAGIWTHTGGGFWMGRRRGGVING